MSRCRHASDSPKSDSPAENGALFPLLIREPFRLFFPWGLLVGCIGVALWPAFYWKLFLHYPGQPLDLHGRLMTLGFGGSFIIGFLSTAGPRMIGAGRFSAAEVMSLWGLHGAAVISILAGSSRLACGLIAMALVFLLGGLARRFPRRTDLPPPGFVIAFAGVLCGLIGAMMHAFGLDLASGGRWLRFSRLLMNEAFLALPVLGVGGFLLPRILRLPSRHVFPDAVIPSPAWWKLAIEAVSTAALVIASFAIEALYSVRAGVLLRFGVAFIWMSRDLPGLWTARLSGTQAWAARLAVGSIFLSWLLKAADTVRWVAMEHVLFITGFGIIMITVASRVVDGHSGNREAAKGVSKPLRWIFWLAVLAMATRVSADYFPKIQVSHYIYASLTWIVISVIWFAANRRKLGTPDPEE